MSRPSRTRSMGRTDLPREQRVALRKAVRWEWITIGLSAITITTLAFVVGGSQAMRTAWIEDMLSVVPSVSFLAALPLIRRPPGKRYAFGLHRAMGIGHLVAGVALFAVGALLATESITGLVRLEHPAIGTVRLFGHTVWLGWLMIAVMLLFMPQAFVYGRAKARLAPVLHNKVLYADADMARADWTTTAASVVGVLGVGIGLWWLDGVAALFISLGVVKDGVSNVRISVLDLLDKTASTVDGRETHPLVATVGETARRQRWVRESGVRGRDMGQAFHLEVFVVPRGERVGVGQVERLREAIVDLDWKVQDVSVIVVPRLPDEASTVGTDGSELGGDVDHAAQPRPRRHA